MSESQTEYETEPETDAEPTPGPWNARPTINGNWAVDSDPEVVTIGAIHSVEKGPDEFSAEANARLIAAAGTAAQEAKEMGYDAVAVQKALPKILSAAEELLERVEDDCRARNINPYDEPSFTALEYALASAEGSDE